MDYAQGFITPFYLVRIEDYPECGQIIVLVEIYMLFLHLFVYAVKVFCPPLDLTFQSIVIQFSPNYLFYLGCILFSLPLLFCHPF